MSRLRHSLAFIIALMAILLGSAAYASSPLDTVPNEAEIHNVIQAGVAITKVPADAYPPLGRSVPVNFVQAHPQWNDCFNDTTSSSLATHWYDHCTFGDAQGQQTIGVYGDSNAGMWIPALDRLGAQSKIRFLLQAHTGCTTWARPWIKATYRPPYGINEAGCAQWKSKVLSAFKKLNVSVVIPISIAAEPSAQSVSSNVLATSIGKSITGLRSMGFRPLLLEPIPEFSTKSAYLGCVSTNAQNLKNCMIKRADVAKQVVNVAFALTAKNFNVQRISTLDLFCSFERCPLFVRWNGTTFAVNLDGRHMNAAYAQLVSAALQPRFVATLGAAR